MIWFKCISEIYATEKQIQEKNMWKINNGDIDEEKMLDFFVFSVIFQSSAFLPPTTLFEELSCTLGDEEHLLEELPSVLFFSLFWDLLPSCPDDNSWKGGKF